jgi:hypothetical protein
MQRFRHRLSPATVIASIALFVSLGGVSYGVATGSIDSREIKNNTVRSRDVRNSQIFTQDIRNSTVRGGDVRDNSLTGADVLESTLGTVPSANSASTANSAGTANNATNANTVGGRTANSLIRAASASDDSLALVGVSGNALTTTIEAPTRGLLVIDAGSDVFNFTTQDFVTCRIRVDDSIVAPSTRQVQLDGNGTTNQEENCSTEATLPVDAGSHKVDLEGAGLDANSVFDESQLQVLFVPFDGTGATP